MWFGAIEGDKLKEIMGMKDLSKKIDLPDRYICQDCISKGIEIEKLEARLSKLESMYTAKKIKEEVIYNRASGAERGD